MSEAVLIGKGLSVSYGGVKALSAVDIEVRRGEVVGLIGPNGAGKTSFIDGVTGFAPMTGELLLELKCLAAGCQPTRTQYGNDGFDFLILEFHAEEWNFPRRPGDIHANEFHVRIRRMRFKSKWRLGHGWRSGG